MGIINYIEFGGVKSSDYGIYVSGEGTFNAPERDVELIEIPGRNGDFSLDKGRFKNITVTYPVFNYETNLTDFRTRLSDFRNALKSKIGYQRLEDTFHPDEYRMATFIDVFEVQPVMYNTASTIELTFNCKPQRFLKSGETEQEITSGGTITNPTLFESQPLLNVNGYGNIDINGQNILISGEPIGEIDLVNSGTFPYSDVILTMAEGNAARLNEGDVITVAATKATKRVDIRDEYLSTFRYDSVNVRGDAVSDVTGGASLLSDGAGYTYYMDIPAQTFNYGTPITQHSYYLYLSITYTLNGTQTTFYSGCRFSVEYDGARTIRYKLWPESSLNARIVQSYSISVGKTTAVSTKLLGDNVYIDLELGEAYKIDGDLVISANSSVTLPAILPVLNTGDNSITFDDTITSLKITPRWWKI